MLADTRKKGFESPEKTLKNGRMTNGILFVNAERGNRVFVCQRRAGIPFVITDYRKGVFIAAKSQ